MVNNSVGGIVVQVHFKAGISGVPNVAKEAADMQTHLNGFESEVKAQCTALEAAVAEIDKIQEVRYIYFSLTFSKIPFLFTNSSRSFASTCFFILTCLHRYLRRIVDLIGMREN